MDVFWFFLVQLVLCWFLPPDIWLYLQRSGCHTFRHGVLWLIGSCLLSASWQQRLRPCVGLCPLHHGVGVVHVPLGPALRYSPSGDPESPSDTAKAAHVRLLGLCVILPPASAAFPGVPSFPVCWLLLALPPAPLFCLGLSARLFVRGLGWCLWFPLLRGFGLFCWRGLFVGLVGLWGVSLCCPLGCLLGCVPFAGFASRHSEQVHSSLLLPPVQLRS